MGKISDIGGQLLENIIVEVLAEFGYIVYSLSFASYSSSVVVRAVM